MSCLEPVDEAAAATVADLVEEEHKLPSFFPLLVGIERAAAVVLGRPDLDPARSDGGRAPLEHPVDQIDGVDYMCVS